MLKLQNISTEKILENVNITFEKNSFNLVLGPNAAGKTTLAQIIAGTTDLEVKGKILFEGKDIKKTKLDERAKLGIFLAFQNPIEIPGVRIFDFLYTS
jgi:Fe-S cluster assembly ATP-binding protein